MDENISRSEKKRRSKNIENLVHELFSLSPKDVSRLPCEEDIKDEIEAARGLKGGAMKRQGKYIAKMLRSDSETTGALLSYMEDAKGSKLKEVGEFHEIERLRDDIINEAIALRDEEQENRRRKHPGMQSKVDYQEGGIKRVIETFPGLSATDLKRAANRYAQTRQPKFSREIFQMLKSALERQKYDEDMPEA